MKSAELELTKKRILERLDATGLSRNEASRCAGLGLSYVNDLIAGRSKKPAHESLMKLAPVLQCEIGYLLGNQDVASAEEKEARVPIASQASATPPLYHVGLPDADGFFGLDELRKTATPTVIATPGVYCISVPDDTMSPRYRAGEIVVVNPNRPVSRGGFAVVRKVDGRVAIREITSIAPDRITISTLDGSGPIDVARDSISLLERIVAGTEL